MGQGHGCGYYCILEVHSSPAVPVPGNECGHDLPKELVARDTEDKKNVCVCVCVRAPLLQSLSGGT